MDVLQPSNLSIDPEAFELLSEPIVVANSDGTVLFANAFARGLLERDDARSSVGSHIWELENQLVSGPFVSREMHELALAHSPHRFRIDMQIQTAAISAIEWTAVRTQRSIEPRVFYMGRLISAQELASEKSNQLSATIFSYSQSAIIVVDQDGLIEQMSRAAQKMFKVDRSKSRMISEFLPDLDVNDEKLFAAESETDQSETTVTNFFEAIKKGGKRFPCEVVLGHTQIGGKIQTILFVHDLTAREKNVRGLIADTQDDTQAIQPAIMGDMASTIAHEVKQPLSAALSFIHASKKSLSNAGYQGNEIALMENAALQVTRAGEIIQNMQRMVSQEAAERTVEEINGLVEEATLFALVDTTDLSINTFFYLSEDEMFVSIDKIQIQQVIHNLIRNALEAMEDTVLTRLRISTKAVDGFVSISFRDSGHGLNEALEDMLFKPFTTTKVDGMGLGLSICRRIVSSHNGQISANNHKKGGAEFTFTLPLLKNTEFNAND